MEAVKEKRKPGRPKKKLSNEVIQKQLAEIEKLEAEINQKLEEAKKANPFWFFEPSTGEITSDRMDFLKKHINAEDIPQKLDGQLDVLLSKASIKGATGGNRGGKSVVGAVYAFICATGEVPQSIEEIFPKERLRKDFSYCFKVRVVGVDHKTLLNTVLPTYKQWCPKEYLKKGSWSESYMSEQRTLFLYKDGKGEPIASVEFMTNQQDDDSFQGPDIHLLIYDEEPKEGIHKENMLRFAATEKIDVLFCMTPTNGITWVAELFDHDEDKRGQKIELFKMTSVSNKKVNVEVLEEIVQGIDTYEEKKMRLLGEFVSLSGLVYGKLFDRRIHVIPPFFDGLAPYQKKEYLMITGLDPHTVTPTPMVFLLLDREGNTYIDRCWMKTAETDVIRQEWHKIVKENGYRPGWAVADKSSDTSFIAFGGRNIFMELSRGKDAIPALRTSEKFTGSINAGVDDIKKRLKVDGNGRARFFIVDRPENKLLINSFRTLERDTYADEEKNGQKDKIKEGKHHLHAATRYIFQYSLSWWPQVDNVPQPELIDEVACW